MVHTILFISIFEDIPFSKDLLFKYHSTYIYNELIIHICSSIFVGIICFFLINSLSFFWDIYQLYIVLFLGSIYSFFYSGWSVDGPKKIFLSSGLLYIYIYIYRFIYLIPDIFLFWASYSGHPYSWE